MPPSLDVNQNRKIYLNSLSRIISYGEKRYEFLGLKYFAIPTPIREMTLPDVKDFMSQEFLGEQYAFIPVRRNIRIARRTRERAQRCVFTNGTVTDAANVWIEKLEKDIEEMREGLWNLERSIRTHPPTPEYRVPITDDIDPIRHRELRAWVLTIPATIAALELGICNEEEAFQQVINSELEDCYTVPLPSIEPDFNHISSDIDLQAPNNSPDGSWTSEPTQSLLDLYNRPEGTPDNDNDSLNPRRSEAAEGLLELYSNQQRVSNDNAPRLQTTAAAQTPMNTSNDPRDLDTVGLGAVESDQISIDRSDEWRGFDERNDFAAAGEDVQQMTDTDYSDQVLLGSGARDISYMSWEFDDHPNAGDSGLPVQPIEDANVQNRDFEADNLSEAETLVFNPDDESLIMQPAGEHQTENARQEHSNVDMEAEYPHQMPLPGAWGFR